MLDTRGVRGKGDGNEEKQSSAIGIGSCGSTDGGAACAQGFGGGQGVGPGFGCHESPMQRAFGPTGAHKGWWNNPRLVEQLKLTDEQRKAMDAIMLEHRKKLIDLQGNLEKAELAMPASDGCRHAQRCGHHRRRLTRLYRPGAISERRCGVFFLPSATSYARPVEAITNLREGGCDKAGERHGAARRSGAWRPGTGRGFRQHASGTAWTPAPAGMRVRERSSTFHSWRGAGRQARHRGRGLIHRVFGREQIRLHQLGGGRGGILLPPFFV